MNILEDETRAILMAKGMEKLRKAIEVDHANLMAKEYMEAIVNPRNRAQQEQAARQNNIHVQKGLKPRPQR